MEAEPLTLSAVAHVARHMRVIDAREVFAMRADTDPEKLARECVALSQFGGVLRAGRPAVAFGAVPLWPGAYEMWMFATDEFRHVRRGLTRRALAHYAQQMLAAGANRAEARSLAGNHEAHRWLQFLGARREAVMPDHGRNRETFHLYAWRRSDNVHYRFASIAARPLSDPDDEELAALAAAPAVPQRQCA